ncbi:MAG: TetR/AcrR family transcriptional regulator [Nocardioidaceae bacterium]
MRISPARRPRDPAARREDILDATLEVIAEVGVARASHRAIANRAGVPLGSTTYYFPTLSALVTEALERVSDRLRELMLQWEREIGDGSNLAADLARLASEYVADRPRALLEYELYLAAARSPELKPAAQAWTSSARAFLTPLAGATAAAAITALLDGYMLESVVSDDAPSVAILRTAIARQLDG